MVGSGISPTKDLILVSVDFFFLLPFYSKMNPPIIPTLVIAPAAKLPAIVIVEALSSLIGYGRVITQLLLSAVVG